ncbi:TPR-like protein [Gymnopus androsaceus JB14]|uniref:TPR-like protein n=1 Tax=Gymnopus androsaceus JB14 TaxID=1447944 RepID=A0A6A4H073_9AGAR|nr:TPR-like protein [Gymnopus androsaceus JB14]
MSTKAQAAKDKGNTAFKNGDFPSAIGHYSQAILEDPKDWTFPSELELLRYLKLGKNEDAEKDCTAVLALNASNVKALFRRAQARKELGKLVEAQKDLEQATSLDPSNESVKTEMIAVKDLLMEEIYFGRGTST